MLAEQAHRLHRLPAALFTAAFGVTRTIAENTSLIWFDHGQYSGAPPARRADGTGPPPR
jgi:hypothetical protein